MFSSNDRKKLKRRAWGINFLIVTYRRAYISNFPGGGEKLHLCSIYQWGGYLIDWTTEEDSCAGSSIGIKQEFNYSLN